jgi:hypothetical protein
LCSYAPDPQAFNHALIGRFMQREQAGHSHKYNGLLQIAAAALLLAENYMV